MKKAIKIDDWHICAYCSPDSNEKSEIADKLTDFNVSNDMMKQVWDNLNHDNRGTTIANIRAKKILMLISHQTSKAEAINTISHEIRHVVDIICSDCGIEQAAHLTGEIAARFADWL